MKIILNKTNITKFLLYSGSLYYLIGATAHFFGLTIFPFYDGGLYTPYHDTVIALAAIVFALFLFTVARDPIKNEDFLRVIIWGGIIAIIFSIWIIFKIDFDKLGAPDKKIQTIVELFLLVFFIGSLTLLKLKK